ncbi:hypothetical protein DBR00_18260 [Pseudomonas sp. HMWF032]|uniref:two-partner secretion domain-containing protein n=1 Tax=Pseudomonas sp. HMWF032 TaxID=2056866 RepID=UPI000D35F3DC|nr:DUF637 domain-containing protein [Pseudomonas sp. HMWF032]PTS82061.1 hypothetical protein DBR00_18260 [Pseudomonas sp. HMWF032]PTT80649.1 hypothetical protein DBR41_18900 [Pseudomonas sp. HMWF010]
MDVRTPFFQNIACVLIGVLFLNPIVTTAAELALDAQAGSNAAVTQAANGVPMVNIATPNGSGLSHNKFTDFNVSQQGLILNNSAQALVQTQLGGYVMGNPNLGGPNLTGGAANVILNEVNGGSPSQLKGYTEVAGKSAAVIVANPHGISCDGCGFINTPRVTLSTGKPIVENGKLDRFDVEGGQIRIEGDGLNARNVSQFDLITRSAQINAELHANQLNVITGRNDVDAANLTATAKAEDGSAKPQLAIDSSALGGMYAGAIRLVGTEAGVGVKLAGDMAASAGDIQIDANGQLSMARTAASRDLQLKAENIELNADTFAGRNAVVDASAQTRVKESLAASQQLSVKGGELLNQGVVEAGVRADGSLNNTATLSLQTNTVKNPGTITSHGSLNADVQTLDNRAGKLLSAGDATLKAQTLENSAGRIVAQKNLELSGHQLNNQSGEVLAKQAITVTAANLANQNGTVSANGAITVELTGALDNTNGLVEAGSTLVVSADSLSNSNGGLRALGNSGSSVFAIGTLFDNHTGKVEIGNSALRLHAARFEQSSAGRLLALGSLEAKGADWRNEGEVNTQAARLELTGSYRGNGSLLSEQDLFITTDSLELGNGAQLRTRGQAHLQLSGELRSRGIITATQGLTLAASKVHNLGTLGSAGAVRVDTQALANENGLLFSGADMQLRSKALTNRFGDIYSLGSLDFALDDQHRRAELLENISGTIESAADMRLAVDSLVNRKDKLVFQQRLVSGQITLTSTDNCKGKHCEASYYVNETFGPHITEDSASASLTAGGALRFTGGTFDNRYSSVSAGNDIVINTERFSNTGVGGGELRYASYHVYTKSDSAYWTFINNMGAYNAYNDPTSASYNPGYLSFSGIALGAQTGGSVTATSGGVVAPAVVQAGGNVNIVGLQTIENALVRAGEATQPGVSRVADTQLGTTPPPTLNQQLPPELAQQTVDPLALPGFSLPQGNNGLFSLSQNPEHPYLIETNPAFASLSSFLNSGYLLNAVGYNPDQTQRRLGDGLYEQRLIQQAIVARTGKRFLAGLNSNEAQFKYLMDNAIASKQALNLAPGIALTAEQVAALTHDIVWMQEQVVNGQKVLVPVLYLAQANDRLAPTGALIQGQDVALISGGNLNNSGTLRASKNLSATANNISNSGLMQAGERLSLLATDSIRNAQGGIINGKNVTLVTEQGDIRNERSIGTSAGRDGGFSWSQSVADNAARIEAGNNLTLSAGRDLRNIGGVLQAGGDAQLRAGRDLLITAATEVDTTQAQYKKARTSSQTITQHGSEVNIGGDLTAEAGQDLTVIASKVKAGGDIDVLAGGDATIASAANESSSEYRYKGNGKTINKEDSTVRQQASEIEAGGDLSVIAGENLLLSASKLKAGDEAYLYAGKQLALIAAQNSDYSLYDMKKKGSWGSKKTQRDEVTTVRNIGTSITTGGDLTLVSEGDQLYQKARLESGADLTLDSGGSITFEAVKDLDQESHEKSSNSWAWTSAKGKGNTDETLQQSQLIAQGEIVIKAVEGLKIDIKQVNQQSVSQTINAMVAADPELAWLKEAEQRGDVDWRQVKEVHDSFKYSHSGLGGPAMIVIAIIVTYLTAGAASGAIGSMAGAGAGSGSAMAAAGSSAMVSAGTAVGTASAGWANVALTAVATSAASNAAISTINNRGNLGAVVKDVTSSDNLKGYATSAITAGVTAGVLDSAFGVTGDNVNKVTKGFDLSKPSELAKFGTYLGAQGAVHAVTQTAVQGGSLGGNLQTALTSQVQHLLQAGVFNGVGDFARDAKWADGSPEKIALHAVVGGLLSEATGGDFKTGALAGGANELLIERLSGVIKGDKGLELVVSQIIGVAAATATGGDPAKAAELAKNATAYNRQLHADEKLRIKELAQGDSQKEARLTAAACALVKCYAEYPKDSAAYNSLKAMADLGSSDAMTVERQQLQAQQGLFNYSTQGVLSDKNIDAAKQFNNTHQVTTRTVGAGQAVLGGVGVAGTVITAPASCATGLGCVASAAVGTLSVDAALAGTKQALSGNPESTYLNEALQSLGLSPEAAMYAELALGLGAAAKAGGVINAGTASKASSVADGGPKAIGEVVPPAPVVTSGTTRTGVVRTNAADWRALRDNWDDLGYSQILSTENRAAIAKGKTPKVDDAWVKVFPEDAGLKGERIPMHHVQGSPLTVPLPDTRHLDAHMPGGFRYNPGGPGSALPAYPPKKGAE